MAAVAVAVGDLAIFATTPHAIRTGVPELALSEVEGLTGPFL